MTQAFLSTDDSRKPKERAWQSLRSELSVSEEDIRSLEKVATSFRHGDTRYIGDAEKCELFTIAWNIVDKYIQYACNGYQK